MAKLFMSYSRSDKARVDQLINQLEAAGHPVWVDRADIRGGEQWRQEIVEAIDLSDAFLLVLSENSAGSDNVRAELDLAKESHKRIIPVQLQPVMVPTTMRYQLAGIQHIDLYPDYQQGLQELLETLEGITPAGTPQISPPSATPRPAGQKVRSRWIWGLGLAGLVVVLILVGVLFANNPINPAATPTAALNSSTFQEQPVSALQVTLEALTTLAELEPRLQQANIRLSEPVDEERTRSYFTGPDSAYHKLAVAALTVVGEQRFKQPVNLDIVDKWYSQAAGADYADHGPLDLDEVRQALLDAYNEYYGETAASLDEVLESALAVPAAQVLSTASSPAQDIQPAPAATPTVALASITLQEQPAGIPQSTLEALTTLAELEPWLQQANIRLSEPVDEERTRSYFTGPDSAYHKLAVASLAVIGEQRFKQPVNLDIVDKWYTQAVGSGYAERGPLDLDEVRQALLATYDEYYGANAASLDEVLEPLN